MAAKSNACPHMPVILSGTDADAWLDPEIADAKTLAP